MRYVLWKKFPLCELPLNVNISFLRGVQTSSVNYFFVAKKKNEDGGVEPSMILRGENGLKLFDWTIEPYCVG